MQGQPVTFIKRVNKNNYLEDQTVSTSSSSATITDLLIGDDLEAFEFEIEGRRFILLGYESKD